MTVQDTLILADTRV